MNKKEIADLLDLEVRTLYNWEKTRPKLYEFIYNSLNIDKEEYSKTKELLNIFESLTDIEKEFYMAEMKAKVLKRKINEQV